MRRKSRISPLILVPALLLAISVIACGSSAPIQPTLDPNISPTPGIDYFYTTDLDEFTDVLSQAIEDRDLEIIPTLMRDPFELLVFRAGGSMRSPTTATEQIDRSLFPPEGMDLECGGDPPADGLVALGITMQQYNEQAPGVLFCVGWGPNNVGEAILLIDFDNEGFAYWSTVTVALNGFAGASR
jgi:hypothetical protein